MHPHAPLCFDVADYDQDLPRPGLPWMICALHRPSGVLPYAVSVRDMQQDERWAGRVLDWLGVVPGTTSLLIGAAGSWGIFWPYEAAILRRKAVIASAEATYYDAYRTDMFLRQMRFHGVFGITPAVLDGLAATGRDFAALFRTGGLLSALPGAAERLEAAGLPVWRQVPLGPMFAWEAPVRDGARYDESEWLVESEGGRLWLTSVGPREQKFERFDTELAGEVRTVTGPDGPERRLFLA
jgi:hypothetical protein